MTEQEILEIIKPIITNQTGVDPKKITLEAHLYYDLGADSLDMFEMFYLFADKFNIAKDAFDISTIDVEKSTLKAVVKIIMDNINPKDMQKQSSKTFVTLTNKPKGSEKPEPINCGEITAEQRQKFFDAIIPYDPKTMNGDNNSCGFNVYYGPLVSYARPYSKTTTLSQRESGHSIKNTDNEIIIEMVPLTTRKCGSWANYHCPTCVKTGECTSQFVKQHVGALLFPDKYGKQR